MGICAKPIQILPTKHPNQILIHKPTRIRLIIPEEVVMQPGLVIGILFLQAEGLVISSGYVGFTLQFANYFNLDMYRMPFPIITIKFFYII